MIVIVKTLYTQQIPAMIKLTLFVLIQHLYMYASVGTSNHVFICSIFFDACHCFTVVA